MTSPGGSEHPFPRARQGHLSQCVGRGIYEHFSAFLFLRLLVYQAGIPQSQTLSDLPTCIPPPPFTAGHLSHTRSQGVEVKRANMESLCDQNRIILRRGEQQSRPGGVTLTLHSSHTSYTAKDATVGITLAGGGGGVSKSCLTLVALWAVARQAPPSMGNGAWGFPFEPLALQPSHCSPSASCEAPPPPQPLQGAPLLLPALCSGPTEGLGEAARMRLACCVATGRRVSFLRFPF